MSLDCVAQYSYDALRETNDHGSPLTEKAEVKQHKVVHACNEEVLTLWSSPSLACEKPLAHLATLFRNDKTRDAVRAWLAAAAETMPKSA
jgi:hypothetical protein